VFSWWSKEGKQEFFKRYPTLKSLGYPEGPSVRVRNNVPPGRVTHDKEFEGGTSERLFPGIGSDHATNVNRGGE